MADLYSIGNRIALLRREKGLTGERFAEQLGVSPQAVSKWENGKSLPETALLVDIARILGTSIDALLVPQELVILSADFSDGARHVDVTQTLSLRVSANRLHVLCNAAHLGVALDSPRVAVLAVKYRTPEGTFFAFAPQDEHLSIDLATPHHPATAAFEVIGAYFGNSGEYRSVLTKLRHYDYFRWKEIPVNQETFPGSAGVDEPEFLTLVYLNAKGIHVISCAEGETLCSCAGGTELCLKDTSTRMLPGIPPLEWEAGCDCTWAGAMHAALQYMGEPYTYEQVMGMSGACYRIAFTDVWDWSATDALVAFDYSSNLFRAIGYEQVWADRLDKEDRGPERKRILADIDRGRPVVAINLRIAPEWGVITGCGENGKTLYCRTYFDREYLNEKQDYLQTDFWPFLIVHFGDKIQRPSDRDILAASLRALVDSFHAPCVRGYFQGAQAYDRWIAGLENKALWDASQTKEDIERRLGVNDATLLNLADARRCAAEYLAASTGLLDGDGAQELANIAASYREIAGRLSALRAKLKAADGDDLRYNVIDTKAANSAALRAEQAALLRDILARERRIADRACVLLDHG